jgi:hypothetical protein
MSFSAVARRTILNLRVSILLPSTPVIDLLCAAGGVAPAAHFYQTMGMSGSMDGRGHFIDGPGASEDLTHFFKRWK